MRKIHTFILLMYVLETGLPYEWSGSNSITIFDNYCKLPTYLYFIIVGLQYEWNVKSYIKIGQYCAMQQKRVGSLIIVYYLIQID